MLLSCCINLVKLQKCWLSKILGMTYNLERREYLIFPEIIKLIGSWQKSSNHPRALSKFIFLFHTWNEYPWSKNSIQKSECYQFSLDWSWWCFRCKVAAAISFQCLVHAVTKQVLRVNTKMLIWYLWCLYLHTYYWRVRLILPTTI